MAEAGPGGDKLILRGLQFHGFHGVKREEQTLGQKFVVDVDAWMDLAAAGESDSIADTISYTDIYGLGSSRTAEPLRSCLFTSIGSCF
jgi:7,8-dihydroneopterin aldolase/epimerase/oxygenase